jgi:hypothetical protein
MSAFDLIQEVKNRGVEIRIDGGDLVLRPGKAVADMVDVLKANKSEIIRRLEGAEKADEDRELTDYLVADIQIGGRYSRLLPQVRNYLKGSLPAEMIEEIELAYSSLQSTVH